MIYSMEHEEIFDYLVDTVILYYGRIQIGKKMTNEIQTLSTVKPKCNWCGKEFEKGKASQIYCNAKCRGQKNLWKCLAKKGGKYFDQIVA